MGLDIVCFVLRVEKTFGLQIPNDAAARLGTPRNVIDYLHTHLPPLDATACPTQRAFYAIRRELRARLGNNNLPLRAHTLLAGVLPPHDGARTWTDVGTALGVRAWPRAGPVATRAVGQGNPSRCWKVFLARASRTAW